MKLVKSTSRSMKLIFAAFLVAFLLVNTSASHASIIINNYTTSAPYSSNTTQVTVSGDGYLNYIDVQNWLNAGKSVYVSTTGDLDVHSSISVSGSGNKRLTLKANGWVELVNAVSIQATNGALDVILWSDADNTQGSSSPANDVVVLVGNNTINTNGGKLVLAGGSDSNFDGIPDGYAYRTAYNAGVEIYNNVTLLTNGGNVIIRGKGIGGSVGGVFTQHQFLINSGTGTIFIEGRSTTDHGIKFSVDGSNPDYAIVSSHTGGTAISITGNTSSTNSGHYGILLTNGALNGNALIQSTGANGGIEINGTSAASGGGKGIFTNYSSGGVFTNYYILSQGGNISLNSSGQFYSIGSLYLGNRLNTTAVNGITPAVTSSSANVYLICDDYLFDRTSQISTTGSLNFTPHGSSFSNAVNWGRSSGTTDWVINNGSGYFLAPINNPMTIKNISSVNGLTIGKSSNTANITISSATAVNGSLALYGGKVAVNSNLTSTNTGDIFIQGNSTADHCVEIPSGAGIYKTGGSTSTLTLKGKTRIYLEGVITATNTALNTILWSDYDGSKNDGGISFLNTVTTNGGHFWAGGSALGGGSSSWNGLTVGNGSSIGNTNANYNAFDLFGDISTNGGDVFIWAGYGVSSSNTGVKINGNRTVNTVDGDITLVSDEISDGSARRLSLITTGQISLAPDAGAYAEAFNYSGSGTDFIFSWSKYNALKINGIANITGLNIGQYTGMSGVTISNTSNLSFNSACSIAGPIAVKGGVCTLNAPLTTTGFAPNVTTLSIPGSTSYSLPVITSSLNNFTISNTAGVVAASDFTVNGTLTLSDNPSTTTAALGMGTYSLTMGSSSATAGTGDVEGIITRSSFVAGNTYTFGSPYTSINMASGGTLPSSVSVKMTLGTPSWKSDAVSRNYDIIQDGTGTSTSTLRLHYTDAELNSNTESSLGLFDNHNGSTLHDHSRSNFNSSDNWVERSSLGMAYIAPYTSFSGSYKYWSVATSSISAVTWLGVVDSDWNNAANWINGAVPTSSDDVIVPDASTTANDPTLPVSTEIKSLNIQSGGILNGSSATLTINGASGAWANNGTFNSGSSTVLFTGTTATHSGNTNFYNLSIANAAKLTLNSGNTVKIGGAITLTGTGILDAATNDNTIEFNGSSTQTINNPNGTVPGYYNLILSGTGAKNLTATLNVLGDFTNNTSAAITATNISFNGTAAQKINGGWATNFNTLTVNNTAGVSATSSITIHTALNLTSGTLSLGENSLILGPATLTRSSGWVNGKLLRTVLEGDNLFPVGTVSVYTPATVNLTGVSGGVNLTADVTSGSPATGSGIDQIAKCNQYWTLTKTGTGTFTSYDASFDLSNTTNSGTLANYIIRKLSSGVWNTTTSSVTGNVVTATGLTSFSYFEIGEAGMSLTDLTVTGYTLDPVFSPLKHTYTVKSTTQPASFGFTPTATGGFLFINGRAHTSGTVYTDNVPGSVTTHYVIEIRDSNTEPYIVKARYDLYLCVQQTTIPAPSGTWIDNMAGANYDPNNDQQATAETDLVGNASYAMYQAQQNKINVGGTIQTIYFFRVRLGNTMIPKTSGYYGVDINLDQKIDLVIEANIKEKNPYVAYHIINPSVDGSGPSQTAWLNSTNDVNIEKDLTSAESYINASLADTDLDSPTGGDNTGTDIWMTYGFTEASFKAWTLSALGISTTGSEVNSIVYFTSTSQTANGDIGGINDKTADLSKSWAELGIQPTGSFEGNTGGQTDPPTVGINNTNSLNGTATIYGLSNYNSFTNPTLVITVNGQTYTYNNSSHSTELTLNGENWVLNLTGLPAGSYPIHVTLYDGLGHSGTAEAVLLVTSLRINDLITKDLTPNITGVSNDSDGGGTVSLEIFDETDMSAPVISGKSTTTNTGGGWSWTNDGLIDLIVDHRYKVCGSLTVGNSISRDTADLRVIADVEYPTIAIDTTSLLVTGGSIIVTGTSNYQLLTSPTGTVTLTGPYGSSVTGTPVFDLNGNWSLTFNGLNPGKYTLKASLSYQPGSVLYSAEDIKTFVVVSNCLDFDGTNDYVEVNTTLNAGLALTLEAWIYPTDFKTNYWENTIAGNDVLAPGTSQQGSVFRYGGVGGDLDFTYSNPSGNWESCTAAGVLVLNKWQHVAVSYDQTTVKIYVDGRLVKNEAHSGAITASTSNFKIGGSAYPERHLIGKIEEIRVWNDIRSQAEIKENMCRFLANPAGETNLVAYYKFDHKTGTTLSDSKGSNTATLYNMVTSGSGNDWVRSTAFSTWYGGSSDWNTIDNWLLSSVPASEDNVGIYYSSAAGFAYPSITGTHTIRDYVIGAGAISTHEAESKLTFEGCLSTENTAELIIKDNGFIPAQIKNNGTTAISGYTIVRRSFAKDIWHFVSMPFNVPQANMLIGGTTTGASWGGANNYTAGQDVYVEWYDAQKRDETGTAVESNSANWKDMTTTTLNANQGYIMQVESDKVIDFKSAAGESGLFSKGLTLSNLTGTNHTNSNSVQHNWNLIGNPFSSGYTLGNVSGVSFYVYNDATSLYDLVNYPTTGNLTVYPFRIFHMQATNDQTNLGFEDTGRVLKAPAVLSGGSLILRMGLSNGSVTDKAYIRLEDDASTAYVINSDAVKMMSPSADVPQIYTKIGSYGMALNTLPTTTDSQDVYVKIPAKGIYTLNIEKENTLNQSVQLFLVDQLTGYRTELQEQTNYNFEAEAGTSGRFKVEFVSQEATGNLTLKAATDAFKAYVQNGNLIVSGFEGPAEINVYSLTGIRMLHVENVENNSTLPVRVHPSLYLVTVRTENNVLKSVQVNVN